MSAVSILYHTFYKKSELSRSTWSLGQ